ncbi:MAG: radical SAM protein, partial [Chloroflexi bacterium]|nr:radical SAM protein [Chloroflexota bacterium]
DGQSWYELLIRRVLDETGLRRLRMSSLQPQEITPGMMRLYAEGRLCPHVHMPLQSGSDAVLKRMRRRYDTSEYAATVARLRQAVPDIAITADVIVGFPGETDEQFEDAFRFIQSMELANLHVFPYSHRPGTSAAYLNQRVPVEAVRGREKRLLALAERCAQAYRRRFVGEQAEVLWEAPVALKKVTRRAESESSPEPLWTGLTQHYVRAVTHSQHVLRNQVTRVHVESEGTAGLTVSVVPLTAK